MTFQRSTTRNYVDYIKLKWGGSSNQGSDHAVNNDFFAGEVMNTIDIKQLA